MAGDGESNGVSLVPTALGVAVALLVCAAVLIVGLAVRPAGGLNVPAGYHVVHVDEFDYGFRLTDTTLPAGKIVIVDVNRGTVAHELVMFKADRNAASLPLRADKSVNEDSSQMENVADSGSALAPGETRLITTDLEAGHYVMVCNLPSHYQLGMRVDITVK